LLTNAAVCHQDPFAFRRGFTPCRHSARYPNHDQQKHGSIMADLRRSSLKIVHVTRAPIGGIFRHILDLAEGQVARGHQVGIVCDSMTGGARAEAALAAIAPRLALGVKRCAVARELSPADWQGLLEVRRHVDALNLDVLHGHGAKGGAFVRLKRGASRAVRVYTPHGGSLHYGPHTMRGMVYSRLERILMRRTDLFLFESTFARDTYHALVGRPQAPVRVVPNGVGAAEFAEIVPTPDATDVVYVGEFRRIKGADVLLEAIACLHQAGRKVTLTLAGDGEERAALDAQVAAHGLTRFVRFAGHVPAREGFALGRVLVVPSRGDSLPYVVIEAAAAGVPMLATRVGGIPEVFGPRAPHLLAPENPPAIAAAIAAALDDPLPVRSGAQELRQRVHKHFSQDAMVDGVLDAYGAALVPSRG
jgi:glycosyltransferase involved in cell wall biosynthesis